MTPGDLDDLLKTAKRMRDVMKAHLNVLDAKAKRLSVEGEQIPSRNQFFAYRTDSKGVIRLQQDAAFFVESVAIVNPNEEHDTALGPLFYEVSVFDANAGRALTNGLHAMYDDPVDLPLEDDTFVPWEMFVPFPTTLTDFLTAPNVDNRDNLLVEHILPRGGVVRFRFKSEGPDAISQDNPPIAVLTGYKIF